MISGKRKKRKSLKKWFCISNNNKTGPMPDHSTTVPTTESMRDLIKSMKIEDLIKTTELDENAILEYRRPRRWPKKRPSTAPPKVKPGKTNDYEQDDEEMFLNVIQKNSVI